MNHIPSITRLLALATASVGMAFLTGCFPSEDDSKDTEQKTKEIAPKEVDTGEKAEG